MKCHVSFELLVHELYLVYNASALMAYNLCSRFQNCGHGDFCFHYVDGA
jgi:hypothetical protein